MSSLETVLKSYLNRVETTFNESIANIENPIEYLRSINSSPSSEEFYFDCYNTEYDEAKLAIQKNWNLLFDAYKTELDLIYKNTKLEEMYCNIAITALEKCVEFRK